jgi:hypothetical protein
MRKLALVSLSLFASACSASASLAAHQASAPPGLASAPSAPSAPTVAPAQGRSLSDLCARVPAACAPFAEASRDAEACGKAKRCTVADVGSCGPWRFIDLVENFSETVRYYDAGGALVSSCSANIEHGGELCFGERSSCARHVDRSFGSSH